MFEHALRLVAFDPALCHALAARAEYGAKKHGGQLRTGDGRSARKKQLQKAIDGYVHAIKDLLEGTGDMAHVAAWIRLVRMLSSAIAGDSADQTADRAAAAAYLRKQDMRSHHVALALGVTPVTIRRLWNEQD